MSNRSEGKAVLPDHISLSIYIGHELNSLCKLIIDLGHCNPGGGGGVGVLPKIFDKGVP